jgi:LmbE family N-acetylglucosaminyl deacetylase
VTSPALTPLEIPKSGSKVLVITAHPDDVDFGAAGTIATLTNNGVQVTYCITTDGHQGGEDNSISRDEMRKIRRREQTEAGKVLGVTEIIFLGKDDGSVVPSLELREDFVKVIRQVKPDILITQSPERNWARMPASHPDHMAVGEVAVQAVYPDARNQFAFPHLLTQGLTPWEVNTIWVMSHHSPTHYLDVTNKIEDKFTALRAHASQTDHLDDLRDRVSGWMTMAAQAAKLPEGKFAEMFFEVKL